MVEIRMFPHVTQYCARVLTVLAQLFLGFALFSSPVFSQTLTVEPGCGKAGSTVKIGGSGWAEPVPLCDYLFYFDGVEFAARQPDGLFGPPNRTATIPASATPGDHKIKVELRLRPQIGTLLQCRQTNFKVVAEDKNPWLASHPLAGGGKGPTALNTGTHPGVLVAAFNPTDVCNVTPCTAIKYIQAIRITGTKTDGTGTRKVTATELGFPAGTAAILNDVTPAGWSVDTVAPNNTPYYPFGTDGVQNGTPVTALMGDQPNIPDTNFPGDIGKVTFDFRVAVFCAAGQNRGSFLGGFTWTHEKTQGGTATATATGGVQVAPSQDLIDAVNKFNTTQGFTLPTPSPPTTGGEACQ